MVAERSVVQESGQRRIRDITVTVQLDVGKREREWRREAVVIDKVED